MNRIDPVHTVAVTFLLTLIALTSWARSEQPGATLLLLGGAAMEATANCVKTPEARRSVQGLC